MSVSLSENIYMGTATPSSGGSGSTVDQTYDPTSANAQSGVAVKEAVDSVLPSQAGNSGKFLTTDGTDASWETITIPSVDIDGVTVTKNASDELQASAVMNARTGTDVLPIWQGTQQQWENGVGTDWYNWRTDLVYTKAASSSVVQGSKLGYNGNTFVSVAEGFILQYSNDDGSTWSNGDVRGISGGGNFVGSQVFWTGTEFIACYRVTYYGYLFHSTNGVNWTYTDAPRGRDFAYYNGIYIVDTSGENDYSYSTNGTNWTSASLYLGSSRTLKVLNNQFVWVGSYDGAPSICTSTDGVNWDRKALDFDAKNIGYGNGLYVCPINGTNTLKYSTDLINWQETTLPITATQWTYTVTYGDGVFVINLADSSNNFIYSSDGINWSLGTYTTTGSNHRGVFGNNKFLMKSNAFAVSEILTFSQGSVYTLSTTPETTDTVYSEPNTTSALTITSVGTGTITLSDNNTYTYTQSGDEVTYQSIGEAHPTWLCNINGVGVKVGTTVIADNTDTSTLQTKANLVTSVDSSSTDSQYPSAKLFYDTVGDIETALHNINSGS